MTLLNTIANMGVILPKAPAFFLMDALTRSVCQAPDLHAAGVQGGGAGVQWALLSCPTKARDLGGPSPCVDAGGTCAIEYDGCARCLHSR